jgi:hypothetical protein
MQERDGITFFEIIVFFIKIFFESNYWIFTSFGQFFFQREVQELMTLARLTSIVRLPEIWRYDNQHNDTQHNDIQNNNSKHKDSHH